MISDSASSCRTSSYIAPPERPKEGVTKKRAPKACQNCRARKVKCNIIDSGIPCAYCSRRNVPCAVAKSNRGRKKYSSAPPPVESISQYPRGPPTQLRGTVNFGDLGDAAFQNCSESETSFEDRDSESYLPALPQRPIINMINTVSIHGDLTSTPLDDSTIKTEPQSTSIPLPAFVKELPRSMRPDDVQYLWTKGAFSIPDVAFRNKLIQGFVDYVYPSLPLIHLHRFLRTISKENHTNEKISLVLFQAILFAGTAFVDLAYLKAAGYSTRREARKAFYQKVRLLYEFDSETDRLTLVQSLLLMTYLNETPRAGKDEQHWLGIAISLAYTIGLNRDPDRLDIDPQSKQLSKRIWWSCYLRDRLLALGMRRPTRITDSDYDVPMLCLEDFDIQLDKESLLVLPGCRVAGDTSLQRDLAALYIARVKLCYCIGLVLATQYAAVVQDQGIEPDEEFKTRSRVVLCPKPSNKIDVQLCEVELANWLSNLPDPCRYVTPKPEDIARTSSSFLLERAVLHTAFFATTCALHRPQLVSFKDQSSSPQSRISQAISWKKLREASNKITQITLDLYDLKLTRYLPATAVTVLLPAITSHLIDTKFSCNAIREEALRAISRCMIVLQELRETYEPADDAFQFLQRVIKQANITIAFERTGHEEVTVDQKAASPFDSLSSAAVNNVAPVYPVNSPESQSFSPQTPFDGSNLLQHTGPKAATRSFEYGFQMQQPASTLYNADFTSSTSKTSPPLFDTDAMGPSLTDWAPFDHYFTHPVEWNGDVEKMDITQSVPLEDSLHLYAEMDYG